MTQSNIAAPSRGLTIAQLVLGIFGLLISFGGLVACGIILLSPGRAGIDDQESALLLNFLFVILVVILLTIPAVTSAIRSLAGIPPRHPMRYRFALATLALLLVPLFLWLDIPRAPTSGGAWLSAVINIITILIPIWWFLELGRVRLPGGSAKRLWGVYSFSTFITLPVILVVEIFVLGIGLLLGALWVIQQPEFAPFLSQLGSPTGFDSVEWENIAPHLLPLLSRPGVIAVLALTAALVIPLIEELIKPLGIWLLVKSELTPTEGYAIGLTSGAAFALLESLFSISAVMPGDRLFVITGRLGTGLLHIFTAGFNGWALAATWRDGRYLRVAVTYGLTVLVHGAWNLFALLLGLHTTGIEFSQVIDPAIAASAAWVLPAIASLLLLGLIVFNRYLRRSPAPPPLPQLTGDGLG